jgi:hypothetical protein
MEIDINNYESILVDYFDGNLNALEVAEVLLFLEQHPDIKNEFEAFGMLPVAENITVDNDFKLNLKKLQEHQSLANKSFNELIIAQIEGDCSENENDIINEIIDGNKSLIKLKNTFQYTKLLPDLSVNYPNKQALKRKEAVVFYLNKRFAAAAALLLLASLVFLMYKNASNKIDEFKIAQSQIKPKEINQVKASEKLTEMPLEKSLAIVTKENKSIKQVTPTAIISNTQILVNESLPIQEHINVLPIKAIASIDNSVAFKNNSIAGAVIPVEIAITNVSPKKEDFLTIGNFMKKKIIERGKDNLIEQEKPVNNDELDIDPITVASVGAGIIEKTTGKKVFLSRAFDKSGTVKSYTFAAGDFKFERIK